MYIYVYVYIYIYIYMCMYIYIQVFKITYLHFHDSNFFCRLFDEFYKNLYTLDQDKKISN